MENHITSGFLHPLTVAYKFLLTISWEKYIVVFLCAAALFALVLLDIRLFTAIYKKYWYVNHRIHILTIANKGNISGKYRIQVKDIPSGFTARFLLNGIQLNRITYPKAAVSPASQVQASVSDAAPAANPSAPQKSASDSSSPKDIKSEMKKGQDFLKDNVAQKAGAGASFLGIIGKMIPGKAGEAISNQSSKLRQIQAKTSDIAGTPDQTMRSFQAAGKSLKQIAPNGIPGQPPNSAVSAENLPVSAPSSAEPSGKIPAAAPASPIRSQSGVSGGSAAVSAYLTPVIDPGKALKIETELQSSEKLKARTIVPYTLEICFIPANILEVREHPEVIYGAAEFQADDTAKTWTRFLLYFITASFSAAVLFGIGSLINQFIILR